MMKLVLAAVTAFVRERSGSALAIFAIALPVMIGFIGLSVDVALAYDEKNLLQSSAEAAALAAVRHVSDADRNTMLLVAQNYAGRNRSGVARLVDASEVESGKWTRGAFAAGISPDAVRVTVSRTAAKNNALKTYFAHLFGLPAWNLSASAVATVTPVCILLLHPTHVDAFDVDPGAQIDAPDCAVQVNSSNSGAVELGTDSYVNVRSMHVVGGVAKTPTAIVHPAPVTGVAAMTDPYRSLAPPANGTCGGPKLVTRDSVISPTFAFCGGLTIDGAKVTFAPGNYVIKGSFTLRNGAAITGDGVLIYMQGAGHDLFFYSRTSFDLKASRTGPYAGIVLWSDRANTDDHDIYSKFGASAEGTIYMPSSQIEFENNVIWEADCIRIIAARMELDDKSRYKAADPSVHCANNISGSTARLVH